MVLYSYSKLLSKSLCIFFHPSYLTIIIIIITIFLWFLLSFIIIRIMMFAPTSQESAEVCDLTPLCAKVFFKIWIKKKYILPYMAGETYNPIDSAIAMPHNLLQIIYSAWGTSTHGITAWWGLSINREALHKSVRSFLHVQCWSQGLIRDGYIGGFFSLSIGDSF